MQGAIKLVCAEDSQVSRIVEMLLSCSALTLPSAAKTQKSWLLRIGITSVTDVNKTSLPADGKQLFHFLFWPLNVFDILPMLHCYDYQYRHAAYIMPRGHINLPTKQPTEPGLAETYVFGAISPRKKTHVPHQNSRKAHPWFPLPEIVPFELFSDFILHLWLCWKTAGADERHRLFLRAACHPTYSVKSLKEMQSTIVLPYVLYVWEKYSAYFNVFYNVNECCVFQQERFCVFTPGLM